MASVTLLFHFTLFFSFSLSMSCIQGRDDHTSICAKTYFDPFFFSFLFDPFLDSFYILGANVWRDICINLLSLFFFRLFETQSLLLWRVYILCIWSLSIWLSLGPINLVINQLRVARYDYGNSIL